MSSLKQFVGHRKKPHLSNNEAGPVVDKAGPVVDEAGPVVDASPNVLSDSHANHPLVRAADASPVPQGPEVMVSPMCNRSVDVGGPSCEGGDMDEVHMSLAQHRSRRQN